MTISKIGSTKNFQKRYQFYREQWDIEEWQFFIMVDFSNTNERVDQRMNELYTAMIQALIEADKLDPFQKYLFHTLMERGGDRLGPKETSWLQMIEIGLQHEFGLPAVSDFVMYDPRVAQGLYNTANTQAIHLMQHLSVLSSKVQNGETVPLQALSSWMSGIKYLSSNVVTYKCILGEQFQDQYVDTLPFPPVANPTTVDEMFDTSKYTDQDKENGRTVLFQTLTDFLLKDHGILFVDSNKLILDNDPNCRISAHTILTEHFQLIYTETFLDGEIVLYLDERQFHAVILHKPVCVASDSRRFISDSLRWKRGLAVATLCNVGRLVRGEPVLSPEDRFSNPIHAMLAFYIIIHGYHCGPIQAAAFYRDFVTPETTNALLCNGLLKTAENGPVAKRMRRKYIGARGREYIERFENDDKVRRHDSCIMSQARSMTSHHPENSSEEDLGAHLITLFDSYPSLRSRNFKYFVDKHLSNPLKDNLLQIWEANTANRGNRTTGPNKAVTRLRVSNNDDSVAELLTTHGPNNVKLEGRTFWIKTSHEVVTRPANGTPSTKPSIIFPDGTTDIVGLPWQHRPRNHWPNAKTTWCGTVLIQRNNNIIARNGFDRLGLLSHNNVNECIPFT
ncbi:hypothetical protein IV203_009023 [Nitzschia inconspicua]|uniref:Uncharacterized protein n=1 Tax=Nitzschia inconspicua TaxID=303405 RepID=A0A9K3PMJ1_9STRA|nr:hypothetical protein IV203_009023 [Nitzschia inconspicua]